MDDEWPGPTRTLPVDFSGARSGAGPLTWGQAEVRELWRQTRSQHSYLNFQQVLRVPAGRDTADVQEALRVLVERHESLRTTFRPGPAGSAPEAVEQVVHASGQLLLTVFDTDAAHLRAVMGAVTEEGVDRSFHDDDWPFRPVVVTVAGRPVAVVLTVAHLVLDWYGLTLVADDLDALLNGRPLRTTAAWQPLDQAGAEASARGEKLARRAVDFWVRSLRDAPATMFPARAVPPEERLWPLVEMRSEALTRAARAIADRRGHGAADVVLAAAALVVGQRAGATTTVLRVISANRFTPQLRDLVGTCAQNALLVLDLADGPFSALVDRSWAAMMESYRYSRYPAPLLQAALDDLAGQGGPERDLGAFFHNMIDSEPAAAAGGEPTPAELAEALTRTRVRRGSVFPRWRSFSLELHAEGGQLRLRLEADPRALSRPDAESLLRAVEKLVVHAVHDDIAVSAVPALTGIGDVAVRS